VGGAEDLNLKQVAATLGVHYMTAYRYVRTGRLPARQVGTGWLVSRHDLASFQAHGAERPSRDDRGFAFENNPTSAWRTRLARTLVAGDETAAWRVLELALAAGHSPTDCYLEVLVGAIDDISGRSSRPDAPVAEEYLAMATASRLVARLGARFRRSGRNRGTVVFGASLGEQHTLAIAVVADLVRLDGFSCLELGADVPPEAFASAASGARRLVAVGIGVTRASNLAAVRDTVRAVHNLDPSIPVIIGGQAADPENAEPTGADAWAPDGRSAVTLINDLAKERRALWLVEEGSPQEETAG
jgi:MerR family transcriptional regulator, light-induced transcriptional regulator